ncbi:hypothetical protein SAMN02910384_01758 [Pseudobutyrivibrio sp. ACV-2]|uniref:hypothetical protein n=1 Tax=Pseudobutyrivibrio sp. ACV-2 TaxID=1520801 RepID=UPI00089CA3CB|nr:hypothetical protein [Pseudobutyrivibrio sp. ACV-2]SEA55984.1 hypothetical protein SAMN02910384_01758 [Pseudobutyrivibrio sp. ACV-2]
MDNSRIESNDMPEWQGGPGTNQRFHTVHPDGLNAQQINSSYTVNVNQGNSDENEPSIKGTSLIEDWAVLVKRYPLFFGINIGIVVVLSVAVIFLLKNVISMASKDYEDVKESIDSLAEEMHTSNKAITDEIYAFNGKLSSLNAKVEDIIVLRSNTNQTITVEPNEVYPTGAAYGVPKIDANEIVGIDVNGTEYRPSELVGKTVLLAYREDDYEVFFYGQINDSYHWDGYCITNAYTSDGYLYGICESNFSDGNRLDYISLYREGNSDNYIYANRFLYNGKNEGETLVYNIKNLTPKVFTYDNVRATDILYVSSFLRELTGISVVKYYNGTTVDNLYDDDTGEAYSIEFDSEGEVIRVYHGKFVKGKWKDSSDSAFVIVYDPDKTQYYVKKDLLRTILLLKQNQIICQKKNYPNIFRL